MSMKSPPSGSSTSTESRAHHNHNPHNHPPQRTAENVHVPRGTSTTDATPLLLRRKIITMVSSRADRRRSRRDEWSATFREWRHNRCIMGPLSAVILFAIGLVSLVAAICQIPQFLLGLVMSPLLRRGNWLIEFLYPTRLVGWGHILLVKWGRQRQGGPRKKTDANKGDYLSGHSRTLEQRVEVVRGRVYIHCIPILMDNISYLIVYCPKEDGASNRPNGEEGNSTRNGSRSSRRPLIGLVVDCGDAADVADAVSHIRRAHYGNREIQISSILSTHKHHDHTAGNRSLMDDHFEGSVRQVYGGAVERVPCCTDFVADGDILSLPGGIRMGEIMEIEAIATPSHTRGSIVYALRNKPQSKDDDVVTYLFTGDSMFCGGGGVPFEADLDDKNAQQNQRIRPNAGIKSVERCFAQILSRAGPTGKVLLFPGHEYTSDLLQRQFDPRSEFGKGWGSVTPRTFFDTASYFFVSHHRRTLPRGTKLLTVPAPLSRELHINPHFRSLRKRGHHLLQALDFWRKYCVETVEEEYLATLSGVNSTRRSGAAAAPRKDGSGVKVVIRDASTGGMNKTASTTRNKTPSSKSRWNLTNEDVRRDVFATVYSSDLDRLIFDLRNGTVNNEAAADRLSEMTSKLDEPVVTRRPVPGTLPSDKSIHLGVLALVVLGSPPAAMTPSDGERMNLPRPTSLTDRILISKSRLLTVLCCLGLVADEETRSEMANLLDLLWEYSAAEDLTLEVTSSSSSPPPSETSPTTATSSEGRSKNYSAVDAMEGGAVASAAAAKNDEIELGLLKIALYGASPSAAPSCLSRLLCQPCGGGGGGAKKKTSSSPSPPATPRRDQTLSERMGGTMRQSGAELVKHDVCSCPMCRDVVGCPQSEEQMQVMKQHQKSSSSVAKMFDDIKSNMFSAPNKKDGPIPDNENVEMEMFAFRPPEE